MAKPQAIASRIKATSKLWLDVHNETIAVFVADVGTGALALARLLRSGELTPSGSPTRYEALRKLVRAHEDAVEVQMRGRSRWGKFLFTA